jgi:SAM-dependent methyltransferase
MLRKKENITYVSTDLMMKNGVDAHASLTDLPLVSSLFDLIYCSNVLEHINDDLNAMAELQRVLKPGGLAIIQVPIEGETTFEDPTITSSEDRDKYFGQADHVRYYGRDIRCRLEQAGFLVEECWMPAALGLAEDQLLRYGVNKKELIHLCRKLQ